MSTRHLFTAALAATAVAAALAACGSSNTNPVMHGSAGSSMMSGTPMKGVTPSRGGAAASGPHNPADIAFAADMIPHHAQAVRMADIALAKGGNAHISTLARAIKTAQDPEIVQMSGWLTGWGQPAPTAPMSTGGMGGMGGMTQGPGMMSDADMTMLDRATGTSFDRMWVQMMIRHHHGAVTMATTELATGQNTDAQRLAQSIITNQTAQISELQLLLTQLPT